MCILFAYVSHNPAESGYQLILANNRDEMYERPTKPADWWPDHTHCISGLDQQPGHGREGGTWMGASTKGKIGILLNVLENSPPDMSKKGRGHLVTKFLTSEDDAITYASALETERDAYNGFNLLLLEHDREASRWNTLYYNNLDKDSPRQLKEEVFGISNSMLTREWKKVQHGKRLFTDIIQQHSQSSTTLTQNLIGMLKDDTEHWPDCLIMEQGTGNLSPLFMQQRSAVYVNSKQVKYGTRTHTVVLIDKDGKATYTESTMVTKEGDSSDPEWTTATYSFSL